MISQTPAKNSLTTGSRMVKEMILQGDAAGIEALLKKP